MRRDAYRPRLLKKLAEVGSASAKTLAALMPCSVGVARIAMSKAVRDRQAHVLELRGNTRIYAPGPGPDLGRDPILKLVKEELQAQPCTVQDIKRALGCSETAAARAIKRLRKLPGKRSVYIHSYRQVRGRPGREAAVYAYGYGIPDAPRPDFSNRAAAECRRYKERKAVLRKLLSLPPPARSPSVRFTGKNLELVARGLEYAASEIHNQIATCPDVALYAEDLAELDAEKRLVESLHAKVVAALAKEAEDGKLG